MTCGCQNTNADDFCPDAETSNEVVSELTTKAPFHRRTLLRAAAIGTTVAALASRGGTSPLSAIAASPCTAGDIEVSNGTITNEPCSCTGTFNAVASFLVRNDNNATRKCVTIILGAGGTLGGRSFVLTTDSSGDPTKGSTSISGLGNSQTMYARIGSLSCNFGLECYPDSVIAFQTAQNNQDAATNCTTPLSKFPGGQCRRKSICVTGFGVTLGCTDSSCGDTSSANCNVACGGTLYLKAVASGASVGVTAGSYTYTLYRDGTPVGDPISGATACFSVANPVAGTYTVVATDAGGCTRTSNGVVITVSQISCSMTPVASAGCGDAGKITFNAATNPAGTCTFRWFVDHDGGDANVVGTGSSFVYDPSAYAHGLDGTSHYVKVIADCGGCAASARTNVSTCATTSTTAV